MNWNDERVERLKRLWAEGLSASQIAAQLGGVSRNAVIGKVHRLNLPGRVKAGGNTAQPRTQKRPTASPRPSTFNARSTAAPQSAAARPITRAAGSAASRDEIEIGPVETVAAPTSGVVPMARRLALTELTERTCKWPVGDPLKEDFHFCGAECGDSSPYCKYHARLAYQPVTERRKAANSVARA